MERSDPGSTKSRRVLTGGELFVLSEIQACWGALNTTEEVFFTEGGDAVLFVRAGDGSNPVMINLTNLAEWHDDGTLTLEEVLSQIRGPRH